MTGQGVLEKGPVIKLDSKKWENNQRMHYEFCGDLGTKKIEE